MRRLPLHLSLAILVLAAGCGDGPSGPSGGDARLDARPSAPENAVQPGRYPISDDTGYLGFFYVPGSVEPGEPAPLLVLLHGGRGSAGDWETAFPLADSLGAVLLVPESRGSTWNGLTGAFGPDVRRIDDGLEQVFDHAAVDPDRIALGGFSDGASYALSLGLANGDLFTHLMAFSPGFVREPARIGRPSIYVIHGIQDNVLPIDESSRTIVPSLRSDGYDVTYEEFEGGHVLPRELAWSVFEWVVSGPG